MIDDAFDYDRLLDAVDDAAQAFVPPAPSSPAPKSRADTEADELAIDLGDAAAVNPDGLAGEFIVDPRGRVRQAGATDADTPRMMKVRALSERSLYFFSLTVLGRAYLTPTLHKPVCDWLTDFTSFRRKGLLMPREHAKSSIVSHALPLHILIQPKESNLYFPGESGAEQRIALTCVTADLAKKHMGVQRRILERNPLVRAFWPSVVWERASRDAPRWNNVEFDVPREGDWPDPSVRAIGVDGAITGAHPSVLVKDDLIEMEAANSSVVMQTAIDWHIASRSLINNPRSLEFIIGTRWAVHDLYSYIQEADTTVEWQIRAAIEDDALIYPEQFTREKLTELQREQGGLFLLLYMNSAADPSLVDFDMSQVRAWTIDDGHVVIVDDAKDLLLAKDLRGTARTGKVVELSREHAGKPLNQVLAEALSDRERRKLSHLAGSRLAVV